MVAKNKQRLLQQAISLYKMKTFTCSCIIFFKKYSQMDLIIVAIKMLLFPWFFFWVICLAAHGRFFFQLYSNLLALMFSCFLFPLSVTSKFLCSDSYTAKWTDKTGSVFRPGFFLCMRMSLIYLYVFNLNTFTYFYVEVHCAHVRVFLTHVMTLLCYMYVTHCIYIKVEAHFQR